MTDKQFQCLMESLNKKNEFPNLNQQNIFKAIVTLSLALIVWNFNTTNEISKKISNIEVENNYTKLTLLKVEEFISIPRFTEEDFILNVTPLQTQIGQNTLLLGRINENSLSLNNKIMQLEFKHKK